jgi:signal transduction histidine kinase
MSSVTPRARILVIDDEPALLEVIGELLTDRGFATLLASDGKAALEIARRERPDLVVCDVNMPKLSGYGVLEAVRREPHLAPTPFIFLTSDPEMRTGMRSGADDYLMKPVSADDLVAAVEARLQRGAVVRREADRRVDEVRRTVADLLPHELRTPLTSIIGSAEFLKVFHQTITPSVVAEMADAILRSAQRLHRMAENYILLAEFETRRASGHPAAQSPPRPTRAADVEEAAHDAAATSGRPGDLRLTLDDAVELPAGVTYIRKIVAEVVDNAFRYSPPGSPVVVALERKGGATLSVADRGRGMTGAQIAEVGAFNQFDRERFEQQGSGVGLALVRRIVEACGGTFVIDSQPGEGTTVRASWPAGA